MISRLRVRNLRSVRNLEITLPPFAAFVGPNGSGKSSILGALALVHGYADNPQHLLNSLSGDASLIWGGLRALKSDLSFSVEFEAELADDSHQSRKHYQYDLSLLTGRGSYWRLAKENLLTGGQGGRATELLKFPDERNQLQFFRDDGNPWFGFGPGGQSEMRTIAQQFEENSLTRFATYVLNWMFLSTSPGVARTASEGKRDLRLSPDGANLSQVLHSIYTEDRDAFDRIVEALEAAIPEIESVMTPLTAEGQTYVSVRERHVPGHIPVWELSDGTISMLTLFTALESRPGPGLLCIEEPENFIHPRLLGNLVEGIRRLSETSQVLITTHSPYLLNLLKPAEVISVTKENGETRAKPATDTQGVEAAAKSLGLGEYWVSGGLGAAH